MSYVKASCILPEELLQEIWRYVDGTCLYIPRKPECKRAWGEGTSFRSEMEVRNSEIYKDYQSGLCYKKLCEKYYLSVKSVQRIVLRQKKEKR